MAFANETYIWKGSSPIVLVAMDHCIIYLHNRVIVNPCLSLTYKLYTTYMVLSSHLIPLNNKSSATYIRLSNSHKNSSSSHVCRIVKTPKHKNQIMSGNNPQKTNPPPLTKLERKLKQIHHTLTTKKLKQTLNPLPMTKRLSSFSITHSQPKPNKIHTKHTLSIYTHWA